MIGIKILLVLFIHLKDVGKNHGQAGAHLEVFGIHRDLDTAGNIQIIDPVEGLLLVFVVKLVDNVLGLCADGLQAVLQPRKCHAYDHCVLSFRDDRAVVDLDIRSRII